MTLTFGVLSFSVSGGFAYYPLLFPGPVGAVVVLALRVLESSRSGYRAVT